MGLHSAWRVGTRYHYEGTVEVAPEGILYGIYAYHTIDEYTTIYIYILSMWISPPNKFQKDRDMHP